MAKVLITGIGFISRNLAEILANDGHQIQFLTRNIHNPITNKKFYWNINDEKIDVDAFNNVDHIMHLAGSNIATKRWTKSRKQDLIDSRVKSTRLIFNTLKKHSIKLKSITCASAIGYYGAINSDKIFTESDDSYNDFIGDLCEQWEHEISNFKKLGIRTTILRTGIVFGKDAGALHNIIKPISMNAGAYIGNGNQYIPWIHISDLCNIYKTALLNKTFKGVFNAVAPSFENNKSITNNIADKLNKKIWLPAIPAFLLKLFLGEMSIILLTGSRISSEKLIQKGFKFEYPTLNSALENLLIS